MFRNYQMVWCNGLWVKCEVIFGVLSRSAVLDGNAKAFDVQQGVLQGCSSHFQCLSMAKWNRQGLVWN